MSDTTPPIIEMIVDISIFEDTINEIQSIYKNISTSELVSIIRLGFKLDGTIATRTKNSDRAILKPQGFFLELLPAVRAGEISFSDLKNVIQIKSGIGFEISHN